MISFVLLPNLRNKMCIRDRYEPCEVLFYAAEVLAKLMGSKDVAIYTVANRSYARLFSATSEKARSLGNSINYSEMDAMYTVLAGKKVYINKNMDERYPLMANAIYSEDEMQLILMIWGIPWERMTFCLLYTSDQWCIPCYYQYFR